MLGNWLKLTAGCSVLLGIILFCVIFGGYSSFSRSENRINASKSFLTDACRNRLDLLPGLVEITKTDKVSPGLPAIDQTAKTAATVLKQVISCTGPLEAGLIKEFETSQSNLTSDLTEILAQLKTSLDKNNLQAFTRIENQFYTAQDNLFVTRKHYNAEVDYFKKRTTLFPGFLIAKLFGFNKITYIQISKDLFLPAEKTFSLARG